MAEDFEGKTLFDPQTTMKHMEQQSDRLTLNNEEGKQKLKDECSNARNAADQQAQVLKVKAEKETAKVVADSKRSVAELEATRDAHQRQVITDAELEVSKLASEILAIERDQKALAIRNWK